MMASAHEFLPWQTDVARQWLGNKDRFAHAWLIHGMPGIGQDQFAIAAASSLLCENPNHGLACGQCQACNWVKDGNHPDLRRIRSEQRMQSEGEEIENTKKQASNEIKIEQIRTLQPWFNTATHRGGLRVALLYMAEDLNIMAANAVLKILEEPPANTVFLLAADAPNNLLPTIVSRCRRLVLPKPSTEEAMQWLNSLGVRDAELRLTANGGAPVNAYRSSANNPIPLWLFELLNMLSPKQMNGGELADLLSEQPNTEWIECAQRMCLDFVLAYFDQQPYYYPSLAKQIYPIAKKANINRLLEFDKWLIEIKPLANHPLNAKLFTDTAANKILQSVVA